MNTYTSTYNFNDLEKYKKILKEENCTFSTPPYMSLQAKGEGFSASFYESGKFVIQGKNTAKIVKKYFDASIQTSVKTDKQEELAPYPHIGIDESGKGDFFGPLVIAGVLLDDEGQKKLKTFGVMDSKKLDDKKILDLEKKIKEDSTYDIIAINPEKYNELYSKFKNLNKLLAWGHATVLENILGKKACEYAISDKFADEKVIISALKEKGKNIKLIQQTKAESDTAVACASILARAEFVKRISNLGYSYEITLPKGASDLVLNQGKKFVEKYGCEELKKVAKTHFKTYDNITKGQLKLF